MVLNEAFVGLVFMIFPRMWLCLYQVKAASEPFNKISLEKNMRGRKKPLPHLNL